jgi:hypothetical protein
VNADERSSAERRRLLDATRQAAAAARRSRGGTGGAPKPGDLYVLDAAAAFDVEWLLTAADPRDPRRVRLVAADTASWVGAGDLEVPAEESAGPLVLRCRHRLWWDGRDLPAERRTGRLGAAVAAAAEERCRALDAGTAAAPTPLERETGGDPEYRDRDEELAAARTALAAAAAESARRREADRFDRFRRRGAFSSVPVLRAAAAVLIAALAVTAWWAAGLVRRIDDLDRPQLVPEAAAPVSVELQRGDPLEVPYRDERAALRINTFGLDPGGRYRLQILDAAGEVRFEDELTVDPARYSVVLTWHRRHLPPGHYELRLLDLSAEPPEPVLERGLRLIPAAP